MFGEITNAKLLDGWTLKLEKADKMPQDLATAFSELYSGKFGGSYVPEYYVGLQLVNGLNHKLIAERTKQVSGGKLVKDYAVVTINIPGGSVGGQGATIVSEDDVTDFVLRDEVEKGFKKAMAEFTGATFKPLLELGEQIVKGKNYHFICEGKDNFAEAEPYLARVAINNFKDNWTIAEIERL